MLSSRTFSRVLLLASPSLVLRSFASRSAAPCRRLAQDREAFSPFDKRRTTRATVVIVATNASVPLNDRHRAPATMTSSPPTIGTHNGSFHCDEALGVALLRRTAAYADAKVVRTRKQEVLDKCDVVIDVGGVYDAASNRFDHHQKQFNDVFGHGFNTRLSSAGLVYKHFGREVVSRLMAKLAAEKAEKEGTGNGNNGSGDTNGVAALSAPSSEDVETVFLAVYKNFMEAVDAIDNGVDQYENAGEPRYISQTNLSSRVGGLNPFWNEDQSDAAVDAAFERAVALTAHDFEDAVRYVALAWLPARALVISALDAAPAVDGERAEIIELPTPCHWKEHLLELEKERGVPGKIKFVIFEDVRAKNWRVQAVPVSVGGFGNRVDLPCKGLRDGDLDEAAAKLDPPAPPGGVFVHVAGFIGGHATREGALCYARAALKQEEEERK